MTLESRQSISLESLSIADVQEQAKVELKAVLGTITPQKDEEHANKPREEQIRENLDLVRQVTLGNPAVAEYLKREKQIPLTKSGVIFSDRFGFTEGGFRTAKFGAHIYRDGQQFTEFKPENELPSNAKLAWKFAALTPTEVIKQMIKSTKPRLFSK
jgi:hypothetical protein